MKTRSTNKILQKRKAESEAPDDSNNKDDEQESRKANSDTVIHCSLESNKIDRVFSIGTNFQAHYFENEISHKKYISFPYFTYKNLKYGITNYVSCKELLGKLHRADIRFIEENQFMNCLLDMDRSYHDWHAPVFNQMFGDFRKLLPVKHQENVTPSSASSQLTSISSLSQPTSTELPYDSLLESFLHWVSKIENYVTDYRQFLVSWLIGMKKNETENNFQWYNPVEHNYISSTEIEPVLNDFHVSVRVCGGVITGESRPLCCKWCLFVFHL